MKYYTELDEVKWESRPWVSSFNPDMLTRRERELLVREYSAAIPPKIRKLKFEIDSQMQAKIADVTMLVARFDEVLNSKHYSIPSILMRSESASSSQIENLTASARNVALAQIDDTAPSNSRMIAANISAMRRALAVEGDVSERSVLKIHQALMSESNPKIAGKFRGEQVWIGGSSISPAGASFVPPHHSRVEKHFKDFVKFSNRTNLSPVVLAAVSHAQFETIHPFIDGNGRTGRALLQRVLRNSGVLRHSSLPLSIGLLNKIGDYHSAIDLYQQGDYFPIIDSIANAMIFAVQICSVLVDRIDETVEGWLSSITARRGATIWRLVGTLIEYPVVDLHLLIRELEISERTAYNLLDEARAAGMIRPIRKRQGSSQKFEAREITSLIDAVVSFRGVFGGVL